MSVIKIDAKVFKERMMDYMDSSSTLTIIREGKTLGYYFSANHFDLESLEDFKVVSERLAEDDDTLSLEEVKSQLGLDLGEAEG